MSTLMQVLTANVCVCKILHLIRHSVFFCDELQILSSFWCLIRYDTIRYDTSLMWTWKLSIQLNLAHAARN